MNNENNPFRFDDETLTKTTPPIPSWGKYLMYFRLAAMVLVAVVFCIPYVICYRLGNLIGIRNAGFPILRFWGRVCVWSFGLKLDVHGKPMKTGGVLISNHASPFDTFVLFAVYGGYMMPKSEVRSWPVMGFFTTLSGAQYLERSRGKAAAAVEEMSARLNKGDVMVFHPEGTTTDGLRTIKFRPTLFASLLEVDGESYVQPVTLLYHAPEGASDNFYGWWGTAGFFEYISQCASLPGRRVAEVHFGEPIRVEGTRHELSAKAKAQVDNKLKERLKARGVQWLGE